MATNKLQEILDKEGIRYKELETACNVSTRTISDIAKCKKMGAPATRGKIAKGVGKITKKEFLVENIFPNLK